jgi:hypothetical protein
MKHFAKFIVLLLLTVVGVGPSICRQCDEDFIGFRKLGMHRKSKYKSMKKQKLQKKSSSSSLPLNTMLFYHLISRFDRWQWSKVCKDFLSVDGF